MAFCKEFNARTQAMAGDILPVLITVYTDKSFTFILKKPPVSRMILKALGKEKGSGVPNREKIGQLSLVQVRQIAQNKLEDMNAGSLDAAMRLVMGTARSMGVDIIHTAA
jgi:large subunit ribosomal protein L11